MRIALERRMNRCLVGVRERAGPLKYGVEIINADNIPTVQALICHWRYKTYHSFLPQPKYSSHQCPG